MIRSADAFNFLCEGAQGAVIAVFADLGLALALGPPWSRSDLAGTSHLAAIGFAGEGMRGAILLSASGELMRSIMPEGPDATRPELLADFLGELANMTAGRVKREFLKRELTLLLATPTCATGERVLPSPTDGDSAWLELTSSRGPIFVRVDGRFALNFTLGDERPEFSSPAEGEAIFF